MDGLTGKIPYSETEPVMGDLFDQQTTDDDAEASMPIQECKIKNWADARSIKFKELPIGGKHAMKFDFIIGNPPYQDDVQNKGDRPNPIYDKFIDSAYSISDIVMLIHPARFLFNAGQTSKVWNKKMLTNEHLKVLQYEQNAGNIFPNTDIKGGVAITLYNAKKKFGAIGVFTPYEELNLINNKISKVTNLFLDSIVSSRGMYRFSEEFFKDYPYASANVGAGTGNMIVSNIFEKMDEVFSSSKTKVNQVCIIGRINNRREKRFINTEYVVKNEFLPKYNVMLAEANGTGKFGEALGQLSILEPNEGATDTFINIGSFDTEYEAKSLVKYIKSKFLRALLGVNKATQHNPKSVWQSIPLQNFTSSSDIDWSKSVAEIDRQLYAKYKLSKEEIDFIETHVKEMA